MSKGKEVSISVQKIRTGRAKFCILGLTPLVFNCMSEKTRRELLMPRGRKSTAEKATTLKHNPFEEFTNSVYYSREPKSETKLVFPGAAFKRAIATAALDIPGANKTQIGRLVWADEYNPPIFGVPQMLMAVVRSADMKRTPDIRTRAILPEWACYITINFVEPNLSNETIGNLLASAGLLVGVGDGRQEKGALNFGQFQLVDEDDKKFQAVLKQGRAAQEAAMKDPACYDSETEQLYSWFNDQMTKTGQHNKLRVRGAA
jgi:hypothetical protein